MKNKKHFICFSLILMLLVASCSSRKNTGNTYAAKVAMAMSKLKSKKLYRFINEWTGVPYVLGGMTKKGIDCSGFALLLERDIYGKKLPRRSKDQADAVKKRSLGNLKEGDLIFFSFGGREVDHVGIYLNDDFFVHASTQRGVIVDDLTLPVYRKAFVKAGTLK